MRIITGDLIELALAGEFDVIVHGCNCFVTMGAGIAKAIKQRFPEAWQADQTTERGDRGKLGTYSSALVERDGVSFTVVNAYTQFTHRGAGPKVDYDAVRAVFRAVARDFPDARVGYPLIGAGLAGGDWGRIQVIIDEELTGMSHVLVRLPG
ncbi:MAG: macro domain-containing protein [Propionibacteriaceae bacterium]|nr:macro domain-containing protein [Propionibacteriaceae bacterium]